MFAGKISSVSIHLLGSFSLVLQRVSIAECVKLLFRRDCSDPAARGHPCVQNDQESVKCKVRDDRGGVTLYFQVCCIWPELSADTGSLSLNYR